MRKGEYTIAGGARHGAWRQAAVVLAQPYEEPQEPEDIIGDLIDVPMGILPERGTLDLYEGFMGLCTWAACTLSVVGLLILMVYLWGT